MAGDTTGSVILVLDKNELGLEGVDHSLPSSGNVVSLPVVDVLPTGNRIVSQVRDYAAALDLINETREAISVTEARSEQLEQELKRVVNEASDAIKSLNLRIATSEGELDLARRRILQLEMRLAETEQRATESETWLVRLHDAVVTSFRKYDLPQSN